MNEDKVLKKGTLFKVDGILMIAIEDLNVYQYVAQLRSSGRTNTDLVAYLKYNNLAVLSTDSTDVDPTLDTSLCDYYTLDDYDRDHEEEKNRLISAIASGIGSYRLNALVAKAVGKRYKDLDLLEYLETIPFVDRTADLIGDHIKYFIENSDE